MRAIYKWSSILALWILAMVPASAETLHAGMSGDDVTALQNSLVEAGYLARTVMGTMAPPQRKQFIYFRRIRASMRPAKPMMRPELPFDVPKELVIGMVGASCMQRGIAEM